METTSRVLLLLAMLVLVTAGAWAQTNNCLDFYNSAVMLPNEILEGMTDWTVEFWVQRDGDAISHQRVFTGCAENGSGTTYFQLGSLGTISAFVDDSGYSLMQDIYYQGDTWYHFAMVISGNNLAIYKNGAELHNLDLGIMTVTIDGLVLGQLAQGWMGVDFPDPGQWVSAQALDGRLDELRIWSTARTEQQLADNYQFSVDPADPDLVAYYNFNEITDYLVPDVSGNDHPGMMGSETGDDAYDPQILASDAPFTDNNLGGASGPVLTIDPASHDFGELPWWESDAVDVTLTNDGDELLTISGLAITNGDVYTIDLSAPVEIAVGESATVTVSVDPEAAGQEDATLTITSDDGDNPAQTVEFTTTVIDPPPVAEIDFSELPFGERVMNGSYWWTVTITNTGGQTLTLDDLWVDGLNFSTWVVDDEAAHGETLVFRVYFTPPIAEDSYAVTVFVETNAGNMAQLGIPASGEGVFAAPEWDVGAGWTMLSLPYSAGGGVTFGDLFGDDLADVDWMVAGFDLPTGWFWADDETVYDWSKGYWLMVSGNAGDLSGLEFQDGVAYGQDTDWMELDFDWNLIALPRAVGYDLTEVTFRWNDQQYSYAQAVAMHLIYPWLYHLSAIEGDWFSEGESYVVGTALEPFRGYWFRTAMEGVELYVPFGEDVTPEPGPTVVSIQVPRPPDGWDVGDVWFDAAGELDEDLDSAWSLDFLATSGVSVYSRASIGLHPDASDGFDLLHDAPRGPDGPDGPSAITAGFLHPDWQQGAARFVRDTHAALTPGEQSEWLMTVTAPPATPLELHWPDYLEQVPDGYTVTLQNLDNLDSFQVDVLPSYSFICDGETGFRVQVEAMATGARDDDPDVVLPGRFALAKVYPNPFNPTLTVQVDLPVTAPLMVGVYNVTGQRVATVVNGTVPGGSQQYVLDGSTLASGVYFVHARVPGELNALRKVVLLK